VRQLGNQVLLWSEDHSRTWLPRWRTIHPLHSESLSPVRRWLWRCDVPQDEQLPVAQRVEYVWGAVSTAQGDATRTNCASVCQNTAGFYLLILCPVVFLCLSVSHSLLVLVPTKSVAKRQPKAQITPNIAKNKWKTKKTCIDLLRSPWDDKKRNKQVCIVRRLSIRECVCVCVSRVERMKKKSKKKEVCCNLWQCGWMDGPVHEFDWLRSCCCIFSVFSLCFALGLFDGWKWHENGMKKCKNEKTNHC